MCFKVECSTCNKATWKGCGQHIQNALEGVALEDRCAGWQNGECTTIATPGFERTVDEHGNVMFVNMNCIECRPVSKDARPTVDEHGNPV